MKVLRFSVEYGSSGEARMLRLPRARGAELHAAVHPGDNFVVAQLRHGGGDDFVVGEQIVETQLAVFEDLLDFGGA